MPAPFARAALLLSLCVAAPAAAQGIVILARGPGAAAHPVGSMLAPGTMLMAGDRIDVLERGGTRSILGPLRYVPLARSSASDNVRRVVAQLLDRRQEIWNAPSADGPRRSASRGWHAPPSADSPRRYARTLWLVDTGAPGTTCFRAGDPPAIWRAADAAPADAAIAPAAGPPGAAPMAVRWPAGAAFAPWPGAAPAMAGEYRLLSATGDMRIRLVPVSDAGTLDDLAVALDGAGCTAQLGYLLDHYAPEAGR